MKLADLLRERSDVENQDTRENEHGSVQIRIEG